jgi:ribose transport system permease protein
MEEPAPSAAESRLSALPPWRRWEPRDIAPLASLAALLVFFALATGGDFLKVGTVVQVLRQGSVLMVVSVGLTFVLLCGEIDLAVGMVALWTAAFCGWLFQHPALRGDAGPSAAMVALIIVLPLASSLLLGLLSGTLTVWARLPSFIITLAMMYIADGAARYLTRSETFPVPAILKTVGNGTIDLTARLNVPYKALLACGVALLAHVVLQHTRFGRYVYMTGGNREAARLAGIRTGLIVVACLAISAVAGGLGGLINAGTLGSISLDQNKDMLLSAVACVVLGGTSLFGGEGGIGRTIIGVLTFTVLSVGLVQIEWIDELARQLLMGVVLMAALVVNGLLAKRR